MERRVIDGYHEAILARLDNFCGIYGGLSSAIWRVTGSELPAFGFSLREANRQTVKLAKMALNSLQELRNINKMQCKHCY